MQTAVGTPSIKNGKVELRAIWLLVPDPSRTRTYDISKNALEELG